MHPGSSRERCTCSSDIRSISARFSGLAMAYPVTMIMPLQPSFQKRDRLAVRDEIAEHVKSLTGVEGERRFVRRVSLAQQARQSGSARRRDEIIVELARNAT